jgi:hypothetical protein
MGQDLFSHDWRRGKPAKLNSSNNIENHECKYIFVARFLSAIVFLLSSIIAPRRAKGSEVEEGMHT